MAVMSHFKLRFVSENSGVILVKSYATARAAIDALVQVRLQPMPYTKVQYLGDDRRGSMYLKALFNFDHVQ